MLRLQPYLQDANATILHLVEPVGLEPTMPEAEDLQSPGVTNFPTTPKIRSGLHGVMSIITSVPLQLFPPAILFLTLLDRLTLASSATSNAAEDHASTWLGFHLL